MRLIKGFVSVVVMLGFAVSAYAGCHEATRSSYPGCSSNEELIHVTVAQYQTAICCPKSALALNKDFFS